jgi:hypothetical protein
MYPIMLPVSRRRDNGAGARIEAGPPGPPRAEACAYARASRSVTSSAAPP